MLRVTVTRASSVEAQLADAARAIVEGRLVAYPTDTLYGLAVDPGNADAVARLFEAKGRSADQAIPLIAADEEQVERCATLTPLGRRLARAFWPGPLALVLPARAAVAAVLRGPGGTVAVRVPDHAVAVALARLAGTPLTATSANRSGEPPATTADEVARALGDRLAVLVDAGPAPRTVPSTIVDATTVTPRLVRAGAVPWERVLESLQRES